jgi:hypothetical protein
MDILRQPYEISIWEERLCWASHKLNAVSLSSEEYVPGKYYTNVSLTGTQKNYQPCYDSYNSEEEYFIFDPNTILASGEGEKSLPSTLDSSVP